jgi:branched-chain amino acid transport system substrate-binding protein
VPRSAGVLDPASLLLACLLVSGCSPPSTPIRIGLLGPVTNGDGIPMHNAARLAVEEINGDGGIRGRPIELVERDDHGSPDSGVIAAVDLQRSGVVAVIGSVYSSITLAVAPIFNDPTNPVLQISPSSSSPSVTHAGPYTFRLCPSDLAHGSALARYAYTTLRLTSGAVLYQNDDYGRGIRSTFQQEFTRLGGVVMETTPYLPGSPIPRVYMELLARKDHPQAVFVAGLAGAAAEALHQARDLRFAATFMGGDGLSNLRQDDPATNGVYVTMAYHEDFPTERNRAFVQAYHDRFPSEGEVNQSGAGTYEALYMLREAIARVGTSRRKVRDAIAAIGTSTPAFDGLTGKIAFDSSGDVPALDVVVGVFAHGTLRPVSGK